MRAWSVAVRGAAEARLMAVHRVLHRVGKDTSGRPEHQARTLRSSFHRPARGSTPSPTIRPPQALDKQASSCTLRVANGLPTDVPPQQLLWCDLDGESVAVRAGHQRSRRLLWCNRQSDRSHDGLGCRRRIALFGAGSRRVGRGIDRRADPADGGSGGVVDDVGEARRSRRVRRDTARL